MITFTSASKEAAAGAASEEAAVDATKRQLKKKLASAACALLGSAPLAQAGTFEGWDFDTSVLHYHESDGRVSAIEPVINVRRTFSENRSLNLKVTLDSLTGATPNGAIKSTVPQTFTRPSGAETYTVPAGETPLDDTFHDTRIAINTAWTQPINRLSLITVGVNFSQEYDFTSMGGNVIYSRDFNDRNTTLTLGGAVELDTVKPEGGIPTPLAAMVGSGVTQPRGASDDTKKVLDGMIGVTQVINARTLTQLNYSMSRSNGYLTDPFKILTVLDSATGLPQSYIYENRPDSRTKHALYWLLRRRLARDVVSGSYRYFTDDWGVKSHTVDTTYHWKLGQKWFLEPHLRFYKQSEADFYRESLQSTAAIPREVTADYRLADYKGYTVGLKYGYKFENETLLTLRAEYYLTKGKSSYYPDMKATIFQIQYSF